MTGAELALRIVGIVLLNSAALTLILKDRVEYIGLLLLLAAMVIVNFLIITSPPSWPAS